MNPEFKTICKLVDRGGRVLDIGCGDGELLGLLTAQKQVSGYGLELSTNNVIACLRRGLNAIQADADQGLSQFRNHDFDYVVCTHSLQAFKKPDQVLREILRVGRIGIVSISNFGHWLCRLRLLAGGRMPTGPDSPSSWLDTPNIHPCTLRDFEASCEDQGYQVLQRVTTPRSPYPSLFCASALYCLKNKD